MYYIRMLFVGLIVGILARFFYPGAVHLGLFVSALLGVAGSFLAGMVAQFLQPATAREGFHPAGLISSILGAMVLIFLARNVLHLV
ncbi:MAG TPA: GlsB/YeaQ/YmgE family stress response membrane protein [Sphingomonas sp.]